MEEVRVKASEGMREVCDCVKATYVSELSGIARPILTAGVTHSAVHGKPYYYTARNVHQLQMTILDIGMDLLKTKVSRNPQTEMDSRYAYGDNLADQLRCLGKYLKLEPLICGKLGYPKSVIVNYLGPASSYYNKFPARMADFPDRINSAIKELALRICSLELVVEDEHLDGVLTERN